MFTTNDQKAIVDLQLVRHAVVRFEICFESVFVSSLFQENGAQT